MDASFFFLGPEARKGLPEEVTQAGIRVISGLEKEGWQVPQTEGSRRANVPQPEDTRASKELRAGI